ncbi:Nucleoside diphosphate pyrophosphatase [Fulvimarina pelagi HTCC2506]|uniref:ADP-ribose pyrophosphatase n=1 Tax=Fulvimarina pelagi HTCC2506 TaxID=314231 RepID=Q0G7R7_9HYPH|nr:NUDIX hydrolase [Fulvimarina pelagi]EAU42297.1 Nucleoside diphosphate pyrophosphatase [Fulvimarina pelagi HTCC2506]
MSRHSYRDHLADQPIDFTVTSKEPLAEGFWPYTRAILDHDRFDGETRVNGVHRDFLETGEVVVIIPYDPKTDSIVVIRQFRIGSALAINKAAAIELPAGLVDDGEEIEVAATRELLEETGLEAKAIERCFSMLSTPGLTTEHVTVYLAVVDASEMVASAGKADEDEDIHPILATVEELMRAVDDGWVENGFLICCAHWFARKGRARAQALLGTISRD